MGVRTILYASIGTQAAKSVAIFGACVQDVSALQILNQMFAFSTAAVQQCNRQVDRLVGDRTHL